MHGQSVGDRPARPGIGEPLTRRNAYVERNKHTMSTNTQILRKIVAEFPNLQHEKKTLEGNHEMTFREAIRALYPTLRDMKKRGFSTREIAEKLKEYGVYIELSTLSKYMHDLEQEMALKSKASSTRRVKKPASQPATPVTDPAPATPSETE